ncbi:hypothetical protein D3C83_12070 [compost metagenome]
MVASCGRQRATASMSPVSATTAEWRFRDSSWLDMGVSLPNVRWCLQVFEKLDFPAALSRSRLVATPAVARTQQYGAVKEIRSCSPPTSVTPTTSTKSSIASGPARPTLPSPNTSA